MNKVTAIQKSLLLLMLLALLLACGQTETEPDASATPFDVIPVENPLPRGERVFGIGLTEGKLGFLPAFETARQAGSQAVELSLSWDMIETSPGKYGDPNGWLQAIAFYGENDVDVVLSLAVINTTRRTTPAYLDDLAFDDPQLIEAFNKMADWVIANVAPGVNVPAVAIGNEVDLFLTDEDWDAYIRFYDATAAYMQEHHPELKVGVKMTVMESILGPHLEQAQRLNQSSSVVMLNDYPQNDNCEVLPPEVVHEHFQQIVDTFPDREIWITEIGYQSGSKHCNSSEAKQAQFYHEMFAAWDAQPQITFVMVDWLHDQSDATIRGFTKYYGISSPGFVEYLSTLGLRNYDHTDKAAWLQLLEETRARGWTE